jgi:hypothetical protein
MAEDPGSTLDSILRERRRRGLFRALAAGLAFALAGAGITFWLRRAEPQVEPTSPSSAVRDEGAAQPTPIAPTPASDLEAAAPAPPTGIARPLPPLAESDPLVRELAARLSSRPELLAWLASDELIRRVVAAVDALAQGESPADQAPPSMRPKGRFEVVTSEAGTFAAPSAFARYDLLTDVLTGLDGEGLVGAYRELEPLFEEAYRDLGHPSGSFAAALRAAIFELLAAPTILGQPGLVPLEPGHGYADPALEELSAAQKQLLRFGPANAVRIQHALQELARRLGIPESDLPRSPIHAAPVPVRDEQAAPAAKREATAPSEAA